MIVEIITPDKTLFSGDASEVKLPGTNGSFQLLNNHAPLVASLKKGSVRVTTSQGAQEFEINGGIVECGDNKVVVLA